MRVEEKDLPTVLPDSEADCLERSKRLKLARKLTGITLEAVPEKFGISKHTFYAWESGRNPIRDKAVTKIITALRQAGVYCTAEWLVHGTGLSPRFMYEVSAASEALHPTQEDSTEEWEQFSDELAVLSEIKVFQKVNQNAEVRFITDDGMMPTYSPGEYVGGICFSADELAGVALNTHCIVELTNGTSLIRHLSQGSKPGVFNLACLNVQARVSHHVLYDVELLKAAPIIWHRRLSYKTQDRTHYS